MYIPIHTGRLARIQLPSYDTSKIRSIFHFSVHVLCSIITHQHSWVQRQAFSAATAPPSRRLLSVSKTGVVYGNRKTENPAAKLERMSIRRFRTNKAPGMGGRHVVYNHRVVVNKLMCMNELLINSSILQNLRSRHAPVGTGKEQSYTNISFRYNPYALLKRSAKHTYQSLYVAGGIVLHLPSLQESAKSTCTPLIIYLLLRRSSRLLSLWCPRIRHISRFLFFAENVLKKPAKVFRDESRGEMGKGLARISGY